MILSREKYQKTVKRPYPPLLGSLTLTGITDESVYSGFFSRPYSRKDSLLCDGSWYNNGDVEDEGRHLIATEWTNDAAIRDFSSKLRKREQSLLLSVKKPFAAFSTAFHNYMPALTLAFLAEQPFYSNLKQALLRHVSLEETKHILEVLNTPLEDNFHRREELDLVLSKDLTKHVKKYEWLRSRNGANTPYTVSEAKKRLAQIDKIEFLGLYQNSRKEIKSTVMQAKKIVGAKNAYLVDGLQFIVFYRTHRTDVMNKAMFLHIPMLTSLAMEAGISYDDILFCLESEILNNSIPSADVLSERKRGYAIASVENKIVCFVGQEFQSIKASLEESVEQSKEIKGNSASKGVARGSVKIIDSQKDFSKITKKDILVASMTTPEMVPIMKIAAAFVTDEGGITCHAAIMARELKKPCIIGTKVATKILKDGDMVEVNANTGVVRKL